MRRSAIVVLVVALLPASAIPPANAETLPLTQRSIDTDFAWAVAVHSADLDGDGDNDVIGAGRQAGEIAWWENDGTPWDGGWTKHVVVANFADANSVYPGDIDGDGDIDLVGTALTADDVAWFENDGSPRDGGWIRHTVDAEYNGPFAVQAADMNDDGDLDILAASANDSELTWYVNDGSPRDGGWTEVRVTGTLFAPFDVHAADLDGDGDVDVLGAGFYSNTIRWHENDGAGGWTPRVIDSNVREAESVRTADLDGDGDIDVIAGAGDVADIQWWENDGSPSDGGWVRHAVDGSFAGWPDVAVADMDQDGDIDILGACQGLDTIVWYENDGAAGDDGWIEHARPGRAGPVAVHPADLDGDGDPDIIGAAISANDIIWFENEVIHRSAVYPTRRVIDGDLRDSREMFPVDLDRDGDLDVLGVGHDAVIWVESDGSPLDGGWTTHTILEVTNSIWVTVIGADFDGDGDIDAAVAGLDNHDVIWFENDGSPVDGGWTQHTVGATSNSAYALVAADVDRDGDLDLASAAPWDGEISWWENDGSPGDGPWTEHVVGAALNLPFGVSAADVDLDGHVDILGAAVGSGEITWWANDGSPGDGGWTEHTVDSDYLGARAVDTMDVDGDGDPDIVGAGQSGNDISWWENDGSPGDGGWTAHTIDSNFIGARAVFSADVDSDGDADVLGAAYNGSELAWWENDGTPGDGGWTKHSVETDFIAAMDVRVADMDEDGDVDILGSSAGGEIVWWENRGGQFTVVVTDGLAEAAMNEGSTFSVLDFEFAHRGRAGDTDLEIVSMELLFEESESDPLTSAEANAFIDSVAIYLDDGSGGLDGGDTQVLSIASLSLSSGVQTLTFFDNDLYSSVPQASPRLFFVVLELTDDANDQTPNTVRVSHLSEALSRAEDRDHDLPLTPEDWTTVTSTLVTINEAPSDLSLSPSSVAENRPVETTVGTLSTVDPNGGSHTYSLVSGAGDEDNALFEIVGAELRTAAVFDHESSPSRTVRVRTTDSQGLSYEAQLTISITDVNEPPNDITLSSQAVGENQSAGLPVGLFSSSDDDADDTHSYGLVAGAGDDHNDLFSLVGAQLKTAASFDHESQPSLTVRVRSTDESGLSVEKAFAISVFDVNDVPADISLTPSTLPENADVGTTVGELSTVDDDSTDTHTYRLVGGAGATENHLFNIVGSTVTTNAVLNYEVESSYGVRIRSTDNGSGRLFFEKALTITLTDVNEAPTDIALSPATIAENQGSGVTVGTFSAADQDASDDHTYTLVAGTGDGDNGLFEIVDNELRTGASFDHETQPNLSIRVRASDEGSLTYEEAVTITVSNVNEGPTGIALSGSSVPENAGLETVVGTFSTTDVDVDDDHAYTLVTGVGDDDNGSFQIVGDELRVAAGLDHETQPGLSIRVRTTDDGTTSLPFEQVFTIDVSDVNEGPTDIDLSALTVAENEGVGTVVGSFSTADQDDPDDHIYTLVAGVGDSNNGLFQIVGDELRTAAVFDHEAQPSLTIRMRTTDEGSLEYEEVFTITVSDVNEGPTDIELSAATVSENDPSDTAVGTFSTDDGDDLDDHAYTLVAGVGDDNNGLFQIVGDELRTGAVLDHETQPTLTIRVRTTDGGSLAYEEVFTITVSDVNEGPTDIELSVAIVAENEDAGTAVGAFSTADQDELDEHAYTLVAGVGDGNNGSFQIVGDELRTAAVFDHETQPILSVRVRTADDGTGSLAYEEVFTITVSDVNEGPTDLDLSAASVAENEDAGTAVGTFSTADQDESEDHVYSLVAGVGDDNNDLFQIAGDELRTGAVLDHETQPSLTVRVRTSDQGSLVYERAFTITVSDVNEGPTDIELSVATVAENTDTGTVVGAFSTADQDDADEHTYTLVAGAGDGNNGLFRIAGDELRSVARFDHETQPSLSIRVRTMDDGVGSLVYEEVFTITVSDVNEGPTDIELSAATVAENEASATVGTLSTDDPDEFDDHTYTLVAGVGDDDNGLFAIIDDELRTDAALDHETQPTLTIRVRTTDAGSLAHDEVFTITVSDVNEGPTDIELSAASVAENQPTSTGVGTFSTADQDDSDEHAYTLVAGVGDGNNGLFQIVGDELRTGATFDHETQPSLTIRVRTSDEGSLVHDEVFTITVSDVNEGPTDIELSAASVAENEGAGTSVGTLSTTDEDVSDGHGYTLVAGAGDGSNGLFQIVGDELRTAEPFDHETQPSLTIRVRATDDGPGSPVHEEVFTITVLDANDEPTDIGLSAATVPENDASGTAVGTLSTTDQDGADDHSYTLVAGVGDGDNDSFQIVGDELRTAAVFDHETQPSLSVRVRTTDDGSGSLTFEEVLTVTVSDVNEGPTGIELSAATVAENEEPSTVVGTFSTADQDTSDDHGYTLVAGTGDSDNALFQIVGDELRTAAVFDHETQPSLSIRVRTTEVGAGSLTFEQVVTITVSDVNEGPTDVALSSATVAENEGIGTVVGFFSTVDEDESDTHTYALAEGDGGDDNGSFAIEGDELRTAAVFDYEDQSEFTIRVRATDTGSGGLTHEQAFTLTVSDVNDAPVAVDDSYEGDEDRELSVSAPGVLGNDLDDEDDALTAELVDDCQHGTLTLNPDGSFTYLPDSDYVGLDSFSYTASDGDTGSEAATVGIQVVEFENEPPYFVEPTPTGTLDGAEGQELSFEVKAEDPNDDEITYGVDPLPAAATIDGATGQFSWTPTYHEAGSWSLELTATDGDVTVPSDLIVVVSFIDEDGDGLPDTWEDEVGLDPEAIDSDGDTILDWDEVGDPDDPSDSDADEVIDALEDDADDDGVSDADEAGDADLDTLPLDTDGDGTPNFQDADSDNDGVDDYEDNCLLVENGDQLDSDTDDTGDACEGDLDGDGVVDDDDNCLWVRNPDQDDNDLDGHGDLCDGDDDDDLLVDSIDNCPLVDNPDQLDTDDDGTGDACEAGDTGDPVEIVERDTLDGAELVDDMDAGVAVDAGDDPAPDGADVRGDSVSDDAGSTTDLEPAVPDSEPDPGCDCGVASRQAPPVGWTLALVGCLGLMVRRRRVSYSDPKKKG